jgi:ribitol-5-phosphate 2-dehydrogenase
VKHDDIDLNTDVIVRPRYMALCHADQRYYAGKRDVNILRKKLPMALIHECAGEVVKDNTGTYPVGQKVVLIPNIPSKNPRSGVYENYGCDLKFASSGVDGFMQEFVKLPVERIVPFEKASYNLACICEFVSVGFHALDRFVKLSHKHRESIGIWGDGSLAFVMANILKYSFPSSEITVVGKNGTKLQQFIFADKTYTADNIPEDMRIDHAFECAGGGGSYYAIDDIIRYINAQGTAVLMGVSENKVSVNTRDILEKGLTFVGSSRSGRTDFINAVKFIEEPDFQKKFSNIVYEDKKVKSISDIHRVFADDLNTPFKTVFEWGL